MLLPKPRDAVHRAWLYRLLIGIADDAFLASILRFKGGTCAAMRSIIERFSIDLDFDLLEPKQIPSVRKHLEVIFKKLGLTIKEQSQRAPQYFLKYPNVAEERNTIQLDIAFPPPKSNEYEPIRFNDIDRIIHCHTIPTAFANKLVTVRDRYETFRSIAGRDIFDIHTFFIKAYRYRSEVIEERTGKSATEFLKILKTFIEDHVTQTILDQDLNSLLPPEQFQKIRKNLKREVLMFLA